MMVQWKALVFQAWCIGVLVFGVCRRPVADEVFGAEAGSFQDFTFFFHNMFSILSTIVSAIDQVVATHKADISAMECATIPWTPQLGSFAVIQRIRCCWVWIWHCRQFINEFWHLMQERQ